MKTHDIAVDINRETETSRQTETDGHKKQLCKHTKSEKTLMVTYDETYGRTN